MGEFLRWSKRFGWFNLSCQVGLGSLCGHAGQPCMVIRIQKIWQMQKLVGKWDTYWCACACAHEEDYRKHCNEDNLNLWRQTIKDAMSKAASFDFSNIDDKSKDKTQLMCEVWAHSVVRCSEVESLWETALSPPREWVDWTSHEFCDPWPDPWHLWRFIRSHISGTVLRSK